MSNYPNGQSYYNYNQSSQYSSSAQGQSGLHRTASFDAGDDDRFFDQPQSQAHTNQGYSTYGSISGQAQSTSYTQPTPQQSSLPYRSGTQSYNVGGYQYQPSQTQSNQYNPAQYTQPLSHSQYNQQSYTGLQSTYSNAPYQPYIPAVYGDQSLNRTGSIYNNSQYATNHSTYGQTTIAPPPPPPPPPPLRSPDYGQQTPGHSQFQYEPVTAHPSNYGSYTANLFSTHSPPPPPPPPHDSYSSNRYSVQGHSSSHEPSVHSPQYQTSTLSPQPTPEIYRNHSGASRVSEQSSSFANSPPPIIPTPPSRTTSHQSPQRSNTLDRHPQGRTLPGLPSESESDNDYFYQHRTTGTRATSGYSDLMSHLNAAISDTGSSTFARDVAQSTDPLFDSSTGLSPGNRSTNVNGVVQAGDSNINYGAFAHDSDAEAAAGLAAMQAADAQEAAEEARRQSMTMPGSTSQASSPWKERSDDSDYAGYDLSLAGGGFSATMTHGTQFPSADYQAAFGQYGSPRDFREDTDRLRPRMDSVRSTGLSSDGRNSQTSGLDEIQPPRTDIARVDTGGTGGLTTPSATRHRKLSFDDGDESDLLGTTDAGPMHDIPDLFFHPGMSPNRPLPPPPSRSDPGRVPRLDPITTLYQNRNSQYDSLPHLHSGAVGLDRAPSPISSVPRSTSLATNRSVPKPDQPMRSKTDADRLRYARQQQGGQRFDDIYEVASPASIGIDLPSIPRKKFNPQKISPDQFRRCTEPWALSSVLRWIMELADEETDLRENAVAQGVTALFTFKVPTMNTTEAETLGEKVVQQMLRAGALIKDEEWVKFGPGEMSGVLFQLTGKGCYSSKLHVNSTAKGRCYAHFCMRTVKKVDLSLQSEKKSDDWATYYKLKREDIEGREKKEIERQNVLHEIVTGEENFLSALDVLRVLYRDALQSSHPPIIQSKKLPAFLRDVFGVVDRIKKVNEDFLLAQLKYRQNEQGPWIVGFSDIFREWIRNARAIYVEYASALPRADYLVRREQERNIHFKNFVDQVSSDPRSGRLPIDNFLKSPTTRLQRYSLLLSTVQKLMVKDSDEKTSLAYALDEVRAATSECDIKIAEHQKKTTLIELQNKLKLRKGMEVVELNLDHLGRQIIVRGDLLRAGGRGIQMVDTHAILFDHYLVLSKIVITRDSAGGPKQEVYDVSKSPVPMDLISVESTNDAPVVKSSVKGMGGVTSTVAPRGQVATDPRLIRTQSTASGGSLQHTNTGLSSGSSITGQSLVPSTTLDPKDDKLLYPFRVKHLGKSEVYILYANSPERRQEWCDAIISAKEAHAEALFEQNAEPFKLRVLADTAFGFEGYGMGAKRVLIRGTPLHRAIQEAEKRYSGMGRPAPICRAMVNCATVFQQPYGRHMCAIGTDYGVYITEYNNPRGWIRAIQANRVTQIAVLEEFNLFILIADKVLIAHHLDVICPASGPIAVPTDGSMRKAPQKLSGAKDVGFFHTAKMKDRILVFYKKKDGINSTFKVLEPVLQKAATSRSRFLPTSSKRGQTDFFRDYDEFYIPTESYAMNVFNTTVAISTARGVEVLILDKKQPWSVPNLRSDTADMQAHLSSIANRIKDLKPLGMFRLSDAEFLVTFEDCAVYVNKHGDISRGVVMEFVGPAKAACLHEQYLILCDDDFVEIRDAQNGRLKQVIAGKEMKLLDDGGNIMPGQGRPSEAIASLGGGLNGLGMQMSAKRTVKLCMQHPEYDKSFVIVELILGGVKN